MKKTRLLEIIREEISGALGEASYAGKGAIPQMKKDPKYSTLSGDGKVNAEKELKSGGTVELEEEKRKKLAEKYQIDEETINEMASIKQLKSELEKQGKEKELQAVKAAEKSTLDTLKNDPNITSDGRLKGYVSALKKELKAEHDIVLQDLLTKVMLDAEEAGGKFKDDIATNTIEKDAANQLLGKEPGQRGRKADPNKPEKAPSTGKRGRPAASTSAGKAVALTPGDDGFDDVSYNKPEEDEAAAAVGSDETAKELGQAASVSKDENFDRIRTGLMKKAKAAKGELSAADTQLANQIINTAKAKYKFNATQVDALRAVAGL
jgi:uncharacterized protein (UPF0147 family)